MINNAVSEIDSSKREFIPTGSRKFRVANIQMYQIVRGMVRQAKAAQMGRTVMVTLRKRSIKININNENNCTCIIRFNMYTLGQRYTV